MAIVVAWLNVSPALSQKHRCQGMVHFYTDNSSRNFSLPVLIWIGIKYLYDGEHTTATYMMIAKVFVVLWCARKALDMNCDPFRVLFIIQVETRLNIHRRFICQVPCSCVQLPYLMLVSQLGCRSYCMFL
jgi:hypothetical protein